MIRKFLMFGIIILISSCGTKSEKRQDRMLLNTEFEKPEGISFKVDEVELADSLLKVDSIKNVFENKVGKKIIFFPEEQSDHKTVPCANNGLIQTLQECYDNHRPLVLTPDVIWLTICQGVSIHLNEHYDSLKNVIFTDNKPNEIVVRNDSLEYSANHWKHLIGSFSNETKKYTKKDFYSFFVSEFTTTSSIDKTAYQVTLLESYKKAFEYIGETGCGIPSIQISGSKEDWLLMLEKIDMLDMLGLTRWKENLKPIISEFVNAADNNPNIEFWKSIYKNASEYNAFYISGWILKLFPYVKELETNGVYDQAREAMKVGESFVPNKFIEGDRYLLSTLSTDNFPSGVAKIQVTWVNYNKGLTKKIEVYAGFLAIKQYSDKSLEPLISWVICEENAPESNHKLVENKNTESRHNPEYWSPHIANDITDKAVYNIKRFKTQSQSVEFIKRLIIDSLKSNMVFNRLNLNGDTVRLIVLSNGKIGEVSMNNGNDVKLVGYITEIVRGLPEVWFPALAHPSDVLDIWDLTEQEDKIKVRVNSVVEIGL